MRKIQAIVSVPAQWLAVLYFCLVCKSSRYGLIVMGLCFLLIVNLLFLCSLTLI